MSDETDLHDDGERARRAFIRKSAEVAAASMFGVTGLDALVEGVIREVGRLTGDARMAEDAAGVLAEVGLGGRAEAQCSTWEGQCADSGEYDSNCLVPTDHKCGTHHQKFIELPCPPQDPYVCMPGETPTYASRPEDCTNDDAYKCWGHWLTHHFACSGSYACDGDFGFACGHLVLTPGHFDCSSDFACARGDGRYDFHCTGSFDCGDRFDCDGYHVFQCLTYAGTSGDTGFDCVGQGGFECDAGGAACDETGSGRYDMGGGPGSKDTPGDFFCGVAFDPTQDRFACAEKFTCQNSGVADDFVCMGSRSHVSFECGISVPFSASEQCPQDEEEGGFACQVGTPPIQDFYCPQGQGMFSP